MIWIYVLLIAAFLYVVGDKIYAAHLRRKFNAYSAPVRPGSGLFMSIDLRALKKANEDGKLVQELWKLFESGLKTVTVRGPGGMISTCDPENIKAMLATQFNDFCFGYRRQQLAPLLGQGIFTVEGEKWKHSRAMLRPNFSRENIAHVESLEDHLQSFAKHIRKHKGAVFDIQDLFYKLTFDASTEFLFGQSVYELRDESIGMEPPTEIPYRDLFYDSFRVSQDSIYRRALANKFYWLVNSKQWRQANNNIHHFVQYFVNLALEATPEEIEKRSRGGYVFLYELVKETRDRELLQGQLLSIMLAGRNTTAGLLTFTMYELARNPQVWERLKEEIYATFGAGDEARVHEITFENMKRCDYLKYVLNETLRLYPNVPMNARTAKHDTTLPRGGGPDGKSPVLVRKGQSVSYMVSYVHRDVRNYGKDAAVYRPERWADKDLKPGWAYLPFNGGPRVCLGQQFALTEASYVITRLVQMFPNLKLGDMTDNYPPILNSHITLSLTEGCRIALW